MLVVLGLIIGICYGERQLAARAWLLPAHRPFPARLLCRGGHSVGRSVVTCSVAPWLQGCGASWSTPRSS